MLFDIINIKQLLILVLVYINYNKLQNFLFTIIMLLNTFIFPDIFEIFTDMYDF